MSSILRPSGQKQKKGLLASLLSFRLYSRKHIEREKVKIQTEYDKRVHELLCASQKDKQELSVKLDSVLGKLVEISFDRRSPDRYAVTLEFNSSLTGSLPERSEIKIVAWRVGQLVEKEIASCRFVKSASDRELYRKQEYPWK
jgi:hypothetical protein